MHTIRKLCHHTRHDLAIYMISAVLLAALLSAPLANAGPALGFGPEGQLRIVQLTDLHFGESSGKDESTLHVSRTCVRDGEVAARPPPCRPSCANALADLLAD